MSALARCDRLIPFESISPGGASRFISMRIANFQNDSSSQKKAFAVCHKAAMKVPLVNEGQIRQDVPQQSR
jgi:hypothetical protein